jgi:ZIP family zinc transporter
MSFTETVLLGGLAGFTIYLGLPLARLRLLGDRSRVALAMFAVGVLAFLFVDVMSHGEEILEDAIKEFSDGKEGFGQPALYGGLLAAGFAAGTAGLALLERRMRPRGRTSPPMAGGESAAAAAVPATDANALALEADAARRRALQTGLAIAAAIGLHNFAEGLAIGVSAKAGEISLATVLIIGFALHNATEGFGIVGPLGGVRPSWRWIGLAGLIGGGPVFLGSMLGYSVTSHPLELTFYALAGGAILYVIGEVWQGMRRFGHRELGLIVLSLGFLVAVATDMVVAYGGG